MRQREQIQAAAETVLRTHRVPGMVIAVAVDDGEPDSLALGTDADARPLSADSLFPIASISKPAVALALLRLAAAGRLGLDDALSTHLPEAAAAREGVTLRALLCHTVGLPYDVAAELAPYAPGLDWSTVARACLRTPPEQPVGMTVRYSNVGYGLLGLVVERLTGRPYSDALRDLVLAPLRIEGYLGVEPPRPPARIAGDLGEHLGTALEPFNSVFWRSLALPWGGVITTAAGALAIVRAFVGPPAGFLPADLVREATRDQTGDRSGGFWEPLLWPRCPWGLGVELRGAKAPHWTSASASPGSFGHVGSSGCLAWVDPAAGLSWAMLGARTFTDWWPAWAAIDAAILVERERGADA